MPGAMRTEATGKFSSRWPLPEENAAASLMSGHRLGAALPHPAAPAPELHGGIDGEGRIETPIAGKASPHKGERR